MYFFVFFVFYFFLCVCYYLNELKDFVVLFLDDLLVGVFARFFRAFED